MVFLTNLYQLLFKNENDSFLNLFFLKFKNLLDDYIVNYKIKYLFYSLFIFFFLFEFVFFLFSLYNTNDHPIFYYLSDLCDLLFQHNIIMLGFYNLLYYFFYFFYLSIDILFMNNMSSLPDWITVGEGILSFAFVVGMGIYIFVKEYRAILNFNFNSVKSFFSNYSPANLFFFFCLILSFFFPFIGVLLFFLFFYIDEKFNIIHIIDIDKLFEIKLTSEEFIAFFTDLFYIVIWCTIFFILTFPAYTLVFYYTGMFICCSLLLRDYLLEK